MLVLNHELLISLQLDCFLFYIMFYYPVLYCGY